MTIETPLYEEGDQVYFKESAALGFLESVKISSVMRVKGKWTYTVRTNTSQTSPAVYGDRTSLVHGKTLHFTEDEFVSLCDALTLAEANAQRVLDKLQTQKANLCPSTE